MEKSFNIHKQEVHDGGFSEQVISRMVAMSAPSRSIYRTPTLITTLAATAALIIITMTVGLGALNEKYDACVKVFAHTHQQVDVEE